MLPCQMLALINYTIAAYKTNKNRKYTKDTNGKPIMRKGRKTEVVADQHSSREQSMTPKKEFVRPLSLL